MDLSTQIRLTVKTGKVSIGFRRVQRELWEKKPQYLVVATKPFREEIKELERIGQTKGIPIIRFDGTSTELGSASGKPFPVSALVIYEEGSADLSGFVNGNE